jgi:hypothetical protein
MVARRRKQRGRSPQSRSDIVARLCVGRLLGCSACVSENDGGRYDPSVFKGRRVGRGEVGRRGVFPVTAVALRARSKDFAFGSKIFGKGFRV